MALRLKRVAFSCNNFAYKKVIVMGLLVIFTLNCITQWDFLSEVIYVACGLYFYVS